MTNQATAVAPPARRPMILVADDSEDIRSLFATILKDKYSVKLASNGKEALLLAESEPQPDLILLDVRMPDLDGYEVCSRLKGNPLTAAIPVMFVSAASETRDEAKGLLLGAVDYIAKPLKPPIILARLRTHLALYDQRRALEDQVVQRTGELHATRLQLIRRLARAAEQRESGLTNRVVRVSHYVKLLALAMGVKPGVCEVLFQAAPLYDIGKLGVPENILRKSGELNKKEWEVMRRHPEIGANIIGRHNDPLLETARVMALTHHEHWDGGGYPKSLAGDAIPGPGRIMAVADAFEAMTTTQMYRDPVPVLEAVRQIVAQSGKKFDPRIVTAFQKNVPKLDGVRKAFRDELVGIHDLNFTAVDLTHASSDKKPDITNTGKLRIKR
jgi:putative two-component system response regulator